MAAEGGWANPLQYTSEQWDADAGLLYLRARWYDPATGRFLTRDSFPGLAALPQTQHPYVYVGNNPVNLTDPGGEVAPIIVAAGAYIGGYFVYDYLDTHIQHRWGRAALGVVGFPTGWENIRQDWQRVSNPCLPTWYRVLAGADMALNAALGISTFMGIGSGIRSVRAAWAMRGIGTAERLSYIRGIAGASGVTVEVGEAFFRPLGQRVVVIAEGALGNPWRLAGGFYHELAHVGQEFGTPVVLRWIPRGLQGLSAWTTQTFGTVGGFLPTYLLNPIEVQAAMSGFSAPVNVGWIIIIKPSMGEGIQWLFRWLEGL